MSWEVALQGPEIDCIKALAKLFESGQPDWRAGDLESLGLTNENYHQVLSQIQMFRGIASEETDRGDFYWFTIKPEVVQLARKIAEEEKKNQEGKDLVESLKLTLRKHPVTAWGLIVFFAIITLATAITQIGGALKVLRIIN